jgi:hypothetical protein
VHLRGNERRSIFNFSMTASKDVLALAKIEVNLVSVLKLFSFLADDEAK